MVEDEPIITDRPVVPRNSRLQQEAVHTELGRLFTHSNKLLAHIPRH